MSAQPAKQSKTSIKTQQAKLTPKPDKAVPDVRITKAQWVPLLPVRYALGDDASKSPRISGTFKVQGPDIHQKTETHFTLRRPRPGYIYLFHKKHQAWSLFKSDEKGAFKALEIKEEGEAYQPYWEMMDFWEIGTLWLLDDDPVWIAFSDVRWTKTTLDKARNNTDGFRDKHMHFFDPKSWKGGWRGVAHASSLKEAATHVSDFKQGMHKDAFWFSMHRAFPWISLSAFTHGWTKESVSRGAVVAMDDPAGMAMDLAALMLTRLEAWTLEPAPGFESWNEGKPKDKQITRKWAATSGEAIFTLKESVAKQTELDSYQQQIRNRGQVLDIGAPLVDLLKNNPYSDSNMKSGALKDGARSWEKYAPKYNTSQHKDWMDTYHKSLAAFDESHIKPLADAHVAWVEGQPFKDHFKNVYDSKDVGNGLRFAQTLADCYFGVQDKEPCKQHMLKWIKAGVNAENLINRAMVLNLEDIWSKIDEASSQNELAHHAASLSGLAKWKSIIKGFAKCVEKHEDIKNATLARLLGAFASPLSHAAKDGAAAMPPGLVAASISAGDILETVTLSGTQRDFRRALFEALLSNFKSSGLSRNQMREAANLQLHYLKQQGVPMDGTTETRILVKRNPDLPQGDLRGLKRDHLKRALANSFVLEPEATEHTLAGMDPHGPGELAPTKVNLGRISILSGILGSLLQYASFCKVSEDLNKAMNCDKAELQTRWWAQLGAMVGATMETLGKLMEKIPHLGVVRESTSRLALGVLKYGGAFIGAAGGLISAGMDIAKGREAWDRGQAGLTFCYYLSAGISGSIALLSIATAFGASIPVWGWALAIAAFLISQLISAIKPDKIQNWLEQCCWGNGHRFEWMIQEHHELALATGA